MPSAEAMGILVSRFALSAPIKTPGHTRGPKISNEAIAIPVGGQTGVTFSWSEASERPSSAPRVYAVVHKKQRRKEEKSAAVFAVRRANYTHRRKGVFNVQSIEDLEVSGNVRSRTSTTPEATPNNVKQVLFKVRSLHSFIANLIAVLRFSPSLHLSECCDFKAAARVF